MTRISTSRTEVVGKKRTETLTQLNELSTGEYQYDLVVKIAYDASWLLLLDLIAMTVQKN